MRKSPASLFFLIVLILCFCSLFAFESSSAGNTPLPGNPLAPIAFQEDLKQIPKMIRNAKAAGAGFVHRDLSRVRNRLFQSDNRSMANQQQLSSVLNDGVVFDLDKPAAASLLKENVGFLTLSVPDSSGGTVDLELIKVDIFAPGFSVKTAAPTNESLEDALGVHYRGIVRGNERSLAAISIFKNEIMGFFSTETGGNSVIGRLHGDNPSDTHIVYADRDLKVTNNFTCDTKDPEAPLSESLLEAPAELPGQCVRIYVEADFDLFQNKGSVTNTTNYLTGLFNQSATLFANDGLPVSLSEIFVWNVQSPYAGLTNSFDLLNKFGEVRTSFNGDFAHLVTLRFSGGIAWVNTFCSSANFRQAYSGIEPTFQNVPTYSWSVYVFTHELGHSMGSQHTHACVWNGNNTAIDGCGPAAGFPFEGSCSGAPVPSNGGTIMSYCHLLPSTGINFSLGFGPQPRNVIINSRDAANCLAGCSPITIGQGAPDPQLFINAANRNHFLDFAKQPPTTVVHRWNCTTCDPNNPTWGKGLIQDFDDVTPGVHDALMLADTNTNLVMQIYGGMWDKFIQLGGVDYNSANNRMIGYPVADRNCSDFNTACFTDAQLVSSFGTSYHYQRFQGGAFVMHRSGTRNGQTFEVHGPIRARWQALSGPDGSFGLPVSDQFSSGGKQRSDFEGGSICFNPATNQTEDNCPSQSPPNDNFANAQVISNSSGTTSGTNIDATKESGEPNHSGNPGGKSVWYRWQAPATGTVTITTAGSNYDTLLAVYTGTSVSSLSVIASNDDDVGVLTSRVIINTVSGTTYRIAVDGFNGVSGNITLNWSLVAPPNPPDAQPATNITSNSFTANWNSTSGATGYQLDVSTNSSFSTFVSGFQNLDVGNVLSRSVTGLSPGTTYHYRVRAYNGNGTSGNSGTIQATTTANVQVTVQTNPSGRSFIVDGTTFTSAQTFTWSSGSSHTISTTSPQDGTAGTRFAWANWSDGGAISHSVSPSSNTTFTANFTTQHFLTMNAGPGGTVAPSSGWFNSGQVVSISASPLSGFSFNVWNGSGSGSFSGSNNPVNININGPITETATFLASGASINVALPVNGGSASASSTLNSNYPASNAINGERAGANSTTGGLWNGWISNQIMPQWLQVDFGQSRSIQQIDVFMVQDNYQNPAPPTLDMTFSLYGLLNFEVQYWNGSSWVPIPGGSVSGNNKVWRQFTFPAIATSKIRVFANSSPDSYARVTEVEVWGTTAPSAINVALPANGGSASVSSTLNSNYPASNAINGERAGANSTTGGLWNGWISNQTMPQWLQVDFGQSRNINQIDVFMVQDNYQNPAPPTLDMTFSLYGLLNFEVQYWNGSSWVPIPGGSVSGNNKVWKQFTFPAIATSKIRVFANSSPDSYARVTEVEVWGTTAPSAINVALPVNGGSASASSTLNSNYPASNAINGERAGANSTTGGLWNGWISSQTMPQWLQVDFGQSRNINQIDVFMVQDNYQNPAPPTLDMTFSLYGLLNFEVQYWNGSSWVPIPGGSVSGNNKVWKQFTFPAIVTNRIRVFANSSPDSYARVTEVEVWGTTAPSAINVALPVNGGSASASSTLNSNYPASNAINGERAGANSTTGGLWNGWISNQIMPQWLQVDFGQLRNINQIDVFMVQDNYQNPAPPTLDMTFSLYGLLNFEVQYWNGSSWVPIPGGSVSGNNKVWKQFTFPAIVTNRIRVFANSSPDSYARVTEVEVWGSTGP